MLDSVVISLPIKPQLKTSLGMTTGLHVGRTIADFLKCKYVMSINLMNGFEELEEQKKCFISDVAKMGINPDEIWFDKENTEKLVENIVKLIEKGHIYVQTKTMLRCRCGRVCIEKKHVNQYGKLFKLDDGHAVCNFCNENCDEIVDELLVLKVPTNLEPICVFPEFLGAEVENMVNKYKGKEIIISKPRNTGCVLKVKDRVFNLDVEFVWSQIFSCFEEKNMFLLASNHQIYVAAIMGIMSQLSGDKRITFILTPYMNSKSLFEMDVEATERIWLNRLFVLNSLKWKKKDCNWEKNVFNKLVKIEETKLKELYDCIVEENEKKLPELLTYSFQSQSILNRLGRI